MKFRDFYIIEAISLISFALALLIAVAYWLSGSAGMLYLQVFIAAFFLLMPYLMSILGYRKQAIILMSLLIPLMILVISVYNKSNSLLVGNPINTVHYFDTRLIIISSILVPFTTIKLKYRNFLLWALMPSFLSLVFFDVIHNLFGVGFFEVGIESPDYYLSANLFSLIAYTFLGLSFFLLKYRLEQSESEQRERRERLESYISDLMKIGNSSSVIKGDVDEVYKEIVKNVHSCIHSDRVSIWEFTKDFNYLTRRVLYYSGDVILAKVEINRTNHEDYFSELIDNKILIAKNASRHKFTSDFQEYIEKNNIKAVLQVPFQKKGRIAGTICCEMQQPLDSWRVEETLYLKGIADLISFAHANKVQMVKKEELERHVQQRTHELETKNKQLKEYAYINSHMLRAPVTRIQGLYQLMHQDSQLNYLDLMKLSIDELDGITRKISDAIVDLSTLDRETFIPINKKKKID